MRIPENKKLRWFEVNDWEYINVIASYTHSRAKLSYNYLIWAVDNWEALKFWTAKVVKIELNEIPEREWELYMDSIELLKKDIFRSCATEENCISCWEYCWESNPQKYDQELEKFTCRKCPELLTK